MSKPLIPTAGYLRMSSDKQDTSIEAVGDFTDEHLAVLAELLVDLAEADNPKSEITSGFAAQAAVGARSKGTAREIQINKRPKDWN